MPKFLLMIYLTRGMKNWRFRPISRFISKTENGTTTLYGHSYNGFPMTFNDFKVTIFGTSSNSKMVAIITMTVTNRASLIFNDVAFA